MTLTCPTCDRVHNRFCSNAWHLERRRVDDAYDRDTTSAACYVCHDLWAEVDRLRALLRRYADHKYLCASRTVNPTPRRLRGGRIQWESKPCDCGWSDELLSS